MFGKKKETPKQKNGFLRGLISIALTVVVVMVVTGARWHDDEKEYISDAQRAAARDEEEVSFDDFLALLFDWYGYIPDDYGQYYDSYDDFYGGHWNASDYNIRDYHYPDYDDYYAYNYGYYDDEDYQDYTNYYKYYYGNNYYDNYYGNYYDNYYDDYYGYGYGDYYDNSYYDYYGDYYDYGDYYNNNYYDDYGNYYDYGDYYNNNYYDDYYGYGYDYNNTDNPNKPNSGNTNKPNSGNNSNNTNKPNKPNSGNNPNNTNKPNKPNRPDKPNNSNSTNKPNKPGTSTNSNKPNTSNTTTTNIQLPAPDTRTASEKRNLFINCAKAYMGTPYVLGGESKSGIDCSGLIYMAAQQAGLGKLPRTAKTQYSIAQRVGDNDRQPGDLVFFQADNTISHVAIYLGDNQVLHSISDGPKTGVVTSKLSENYWKNHYYASGKIFKD